MELDTLFAGVQDAARQLQSADDRLINSLLEGIADAALEHSEAILEANRLDLSRMDPADPKYDRLMLTPQRLQGIAADTRKVASLPSPVGRTLRESVLPNGLRIKRVSVPFGVIGVIYEARPNVSFDVAALCLKSQNACILKGGSDAQCTNQVIAETIHGVLQRFGMNPHVVELLPPAREATEQLLHAEGLVDLIIPRGSSRLIRFVRQNATVPVIETGAGICHTYFDLQGDAEKGARIIHNAKTRRVSVCNAMDCLIIHAGRLADLPRLCCRLADSRVVIYADEPARAVLQGCYPADLLLTASADSYGTEFLDYKMAVKTVSSLDEALAHIRRYGSKHSESIVTEEPLNASRFCREVDAACVYVNAPTSFTDGAQFGLGAEIGISTQKLHARGPMALEEITTYKWLIEGDGQVRD